MLGAHAVWVRAAVDCHEAKLLRYASDIVGPQLARDVVQETFLKLCKADRQQIEDHLSAWLFTVCRNAAIEVRRKVRHLTALDPQLPDANQGSFDTLARAESMQRIRSGLLALSDQQREVVRLKFDADLSYKEIAEVTGLTISNVGFILHAALTRLREQLGRDNLHVVAARRAR